MNELNGDRAAWLRCYRCWSTRLEAQVHYDAIIRVDPESGETAERVEEIQEAVVQCLDCMHDQPHLGIEEGRVVPVEDRWERMVAGTPWVASCTVTVDQDLVETCSGPDAADSLTYASFGEQGTREFFTHVRFHKHDEERIIVHLLVELYARSGEEASEVLEEASRGVLELTSLAEESRPPAHAADEAPLGEPLQPPMPVAEEEGDDRRGDSLDARDPGDAALELESEAVGHRAAPLPRRLDDPFVLPERKGQRPRALEEAPARLELGEAEVVVVDREHAAEQDPAPAQRHPDLDVVDRLLAQAARHRHPQDRRQLVVDPFRGHRARPDRCGG